MPIYRKDRYGGLFKLFVEQKFTRPNAPGREFCLYFDGKGDSGVADIAQCLNSTQQAAEYEYDQQRAKHSL